MQGTVSAFDPDTRSGAVLLDDGVTLPFTSEALEGSGLLLLRAGQRVRLETSGEDAPRQVARLQLITLA